MQDAAEPWDSWHWAPSMVPCTRPFLYHNALYLFEPFLHTLLFHCSVDSSMLQILFSQYPLSTTVVRGITKWQNTNSLLANSTSTTNMTNYTNTRTLSFSAACSRICRCFFSEKNMKADLKRFGASGAFLYLVTLPFLRGMVVVHSSLLHQSLPSNSCTTIDVCEVKVAPAYEEKK